ncbi:MAG: tetratricopeptide repeat protein [Spirochaetaceae bacterium]|jgi:Flp pilus assembly protein TadD|nr:tetratricopeptide repeat protein [Spirochaetaceae bacterium]
MSDDLFAQAQGAVRAGNLTEAEGLLKKYLDKLPDDRDARSLRGTVLAKMGKLPEAEEYLIALAAVSQDIEVLNNLAVIYGRQDKLQDALGTLTDAIDMDPTKTELYYNIGAVYERLGNYKAASMAYAKVAELTDGYVPAYNRLGIVQFKLGLLPKALETFARILGDHPDHAAILNNRGVVLTGQGKTEEAIQSYRQALAADPHYAPAAANLELAGKAPDNTETAFLFDKEPEFLFIDNLNAGGGEISEELSLEEPQKEKKPPISSKTALELMLYLKRMAEELPPKAKGYFLSSDARLSMEYLIAVLEGHAGIFQEIQERELAPASGDAAPQAVPGKKVPDLPATLDYLRKMAEALADPNLSAILQRKMDSVISDLNENTSGPPA